MNTSTFEPAYLRLVENGELAARAAEAYRRMEKCEMCSVRCRSNRFSGKPGGCRISERARVSSYGPHMGEEPVLTGWRGSGTIFDHQLPADQYSSPSPNSHYSPPFAV